MGQASLGFWYQVFGDEESKFILSFFFTLYSLLSSKGSKISGLFYFVLILLLAMVPF
jgi:hypothetical protein